MADEIRYLYEMKEYRVGGKWMTDTIEVGVMRNWVGFETEVNDANDTDAPGNPWGHGCLLYTSSKGFSIAEKKLDYYK